jgi:arylesterase/paraoxonase
MKSIVIALIVVVLAAVWLVFDTVKDAGELKKLKPHDSGRCRTITGVVGAEDITIHPQTGMAFISSDDRRALFRGEQTQGAIYAYDLKSDTSNLVHLTQDFAHEFHPHGISLLAGGNGAASLFVVNHRQDGHFVEIFDYADNRLLHRESISGELMTSPNDVAAVGPRSFYVTNDHGNVSAFGRTLEEYLRLERSYVLYYDGEKFRVVAKDLSYANGINVSHDGKKIYVAATTGLRINVYDRDLASNELKLSQEIDLGTGVDNIELDAAGNLWIGAHPQLLTFTRYAKDPARLSPSEILKISFAPNNDYQVEQVYLNEGEAISGSSVGAVFEQKLLIGSVFDEHFLVCEMGE